MVHFEAFSTCRQLSWSCTFRYTMCCCVQIVNLVSNDVRRFDDAMPFWPFLYAGPLELAIILVLLSFQLGAPAAFAGVATMLLVIPTQVTPCPLGCVALQEASRHSTSCSEAVTGWP